jgi:hypothetical protein
VNLETTLERTTPTSTQWVAWTQQEPAVADLAYQDMRWQLRTAGPARKDELLGALVRLVQSDPGAFGVLAACMVPALRHRVALRAPSLDRQDALAVVVAGLYEAAVRYDVESHPRYVAESCSPSRPGGSAAPSPSTGGGTFIHGKRATVCLAPPALSCHPADC